MSLFKSLHRGHFLLLWSGQTLSRLGDSVYRVAFAWWILKQTGSATMMGSTLLFSFVPMLILFPVSGLVVDWFSRTRLMLLSDIVRAVIVALIGLLAMFQVLRPAHIYVASVIFGVADAFFQPAYKALLPEITAIEELRSANSLTNLSRQASDTIGPIICAMLVAQIGIYTAFFVNAGSFVISAWLISKLPSKAGRIPHKSVILKNLKEGIGTVINTPWLWVTIVIAALTNVTLYGPLHVALPFLIGDSLQQGIGSLGLIYSLIALGSMVSTVWFGHTTRIQSRGLLAYIAWLGSGLLLFGLGLRLPLFTLGIFAAGIGALLAIVGLIWINTVQELVPNELLGRVSSIDSLGSFLLLPVGYLVVGRLTDSYGPQTVFQVSGLLTALLVLVGLAHPQIRQVR